MCTGKCSRFVASSLYPLVLISIICNILLFFPGWKVKYAQDGALTKEVNYMGGLVGGGIMVMTPALFIHLTGQRGCCANRCGMCMTILFAAVGVCGAFYSFAVALMGLIHGPYCRYNLIVWGTPFKYESESYLAHQDLWGRCFEPKNVVEFNIGLFSILLVCSGLQFILCAAQMINGLIGCLCGACID